MPRALELRLMREARKKGYTGKRKDRYVYGTLNKIEHKKRKRRR